MNDFVKSKIKWKYKLHKIYTKNDYICNDCLQLKEATFLVSQVMAIRKEEYTIIASKLNKANHIKPLVHRNFICQYHDVRRGDYLITFR